MGPHLEDLRINVDDPANFICPRLTSLYIAKGSMLSSSKLECVHAGSTRNLGSHSLDVFNNLHIWAPNLQILKCKGIKLSSLAIIKHDKLTRFEFRNSSGTENLSICCPNLTWLSLHSTYFYNFVKLPETTDKIDLKKLECPKLSFMNLSHNALSENCFEGVKELFPELTVIPPFEI